MNSVCLAWHTILARCIRSENGAYFQNEGVSNGELHRMHRKQETLFHCAGAADYSLLCTI